MSQSTVPQNALPTSCAVELRSTFHSEIDSLFRSLEHRRPTTSGRRSVENALFVGLGG
jgi:hypothetical protein